MDTHSTLICVLGLLFLLSGSAHSKCPANDKCEQFFNQTTGMCMPLSIANKHPNECPKQCRGLCEFPQYCACCKSCKAVKCDEGMGYVCMTKEIAANSRWFDYKKDCKEGDEYCQKWSSEPCLCCPKKPSIEDCCLDKGCKEAFDGVGICVDIGAPDWNLNHDIDLTFGMKIGLCSNMNKESYCGCFKKKEETPACKEDKKCKSNKKITKKCYKENDAPANYFWTEIFCNNTKECKCYQRCKSNKKCSKKRGKCLDAGPKPPVGWKAIGPCDKKKKCICYIKG